MSSKQNKRKGFDDLLALREDLDDVSPPWGAAPDPEADKAAGESRPAISPATVPAPYETQGEGELDTREQADLVTCETALDNLRIAFWAAGKALQTIRDARLYRATHATFEDYCQDRWGMTRQQASRLIQAWPLAEALSPIGDKINESQVRVLLPLADRHGPEAAVTVYQAVVEADGIRLTADVLKDAAQLVMPATRFDPAEAAQQIRKYLAGELDPAPPRAAAATAFKAELGRLRAITKRDSLRAAARENPDEVRQVIAELIKELRALLDDIDPTK